jgi:hypothetical protein
MIVRALARDRPSDIDVLGVQCPKSAARSSQDFSIHDFSMPCGTPTTG